MTGITVDKLARIVGIPSKQILSKLKSAGINVTSSDQVISDSQKNILLNHIKKVTHNSNNENVQTLKLKKNSNLLSITINKNVVNVTTIRKRRMNHHVFDKELLDNVKNDIEKNNLINDINYSDNNQNSCEINSNLTKNELLVDDNLVSLNTIEHQRENNVIKNNSKDSKKKLVKLSQITNKSKKQSDSNNIIIKENNFFQKKEIIIPKSLTVADLAKKMAIKINEVIKVLMQLGNIATINQIIDQDTAALVVEEMGFVAKLVKETILEDNLIFSEDILPNINAIKRAPVVTIMGHVDHGKTSLLDYIRRTKVASREAGGITQHIGAYSVQTKYGMITFLDTPGHEAFTAMRARGAACTDIVVLVVAADDGVMPQTIEAIKHAQLANVAMIVAINKIDKLDSNPEKVRNELIKNNVLPDDLGGDVMFQYISSKTGKGIEELLEAISIVADLNELKAPINCLAKGIVIESHLNKGYGPVASVLVQKGTLYQGNIVLAGLHYGKIRAMFDDTGKKITEAGPSVPVEILGLSGVPSAGDDLFVTTSEKKAREASLFRQGKYRDIKLSNQKIVSLDNVLDKMKKSNEKTLNIVLKTDVNGSTEAISEMLKKITIDDIRVNVVSSGVGGINESDVNLALASSGMILGFNVRSDSNAKNLAEKEGIEIRYYSVIYKIFDDIKNALTGMLIPKYIEQITGMAIVREIFKSSKFGTIAGCMITSGIIKSNNLIRVLRDNVIFHQGEIGSLRRFKEDVNEVRQGMECGIGIKINDQSISLGDTIEAYKSVLSKNNHSEK